MKSKEYPKTPYERNLVYDNLANSYAVIASRKYDSNLMFSDDPENALLALERAMLTMDREAVAQKKRTPYGGICNGCRKETEEYCHDHLCLKCCIKRQELEAEYYE